MVLFTSFEYVNKTIGQWAEILKIPLTAVPLYLSANNMSVVLRESVCDTVTHVCSVVKETPVVGMPPLPTGAESPYNPDGSPKWLTWKIVNGTIISTVHETRQAYEKALAAGETTNREALVSQLLKPASPAVAAATASTELQPVPTAPIVPPVTPPPAPPPAPQIPSWLPLAVIIGAAYFLTRRRK